MIERGSHLPPGAHTSASLSLFYHLLAMCHRSAFSLALQIAKPEIDHLHLVHVLSADAWTPITSPDVRDLLPVCVAHQCQTLSQTNRNFPCPSLPSQERHAVKEELKGGAIASLKQYRGVAAKEAGFANVSAHLLM